MSPVWVKLGDFGVSKRIRAQATITFHTQVLTQVYSAPEVLGLDSNSETSNYTNSVDIWSLGCVIYELLVGTQFFVSEAQVSRYFFGKRLFPEDKLKEFSVRRRPGARRGPGGGLPRAPDGTGRLAIVRPGRPKRKTAVFGQDGGPYRVRHVSAG